MRYLLIFFVLLFTFFCHDPSHNIIAKVGLKTLSVNDFNIQYLKFLSKFDLKDNLFYRNKFLDNEINRLVILSLADSLGYDYSSLSSTRNQKIINEYCIRELYNKFELSDSLLRQYFIRSKTDINARHLYADNLEKANQLVDMLDGGASFQILAQNIFKDSLLANNGGDLGYFSFGDMDIAFEDAVFSLEPGEISNPIKTSSGYSIVQVIDKWVEPFITEQDYQLNKHDILSISKNRSVNLIRKNYVKQLSTELDIYISNQHLELLFSNLLKIYSDIEFDQSHSIKLYSKLGVWDFNKLKFKIQELLPNQINRIKCKEHLFESLKGILSRNKILEIAKSKTWFSSPEFQQELIRSTEDKLIGIVVNEFQSIDSTLEKKYKNIISNYRKTFLIHINKNLLERMEVSS